MNPRYLPVSVACFVVLAVLAWSAGTGRNAAEDRIGAADQNYNRLVRSVGEQRLDLDVSVPDGLKNLSDPYDPVRNDPYRSKPFWLHDLSYYRGKIYMYFGVTPALLLFAPWTVVTEGYLRHSWGVAIFCAGGFLASIWLLMDIRRRYFREIGEFVLGAVALAVGFSSGLPILLQRADFWEVAVTCGQALVMLALVGIWRALHDQNQVRWLAMASLAYGLALGARPSMLFGSAVLLVPILWEYRRKNPGRIRVAALLLAALGPLALCAVALAGYNRLRFGHALEFGQTYQLSGERQADVRHFSFRYFCTNFRIYFWQPASWSRSFPFVRLSQIPPLPIGHGVVENCFGAALNLPFVWLAFAAPVAWLRRAGGRQGRLVLFVAAVTWLFASNCAVLCLFFGCTLRYEFEILSPFALLAAMGALGVENLLHSRPAWLVVGRGLGATMAAYSVVFASFASIHLHALQLDQLAEMRFSEQNFAGAASAFEAVLQYEPGDSEASARLCMKLVGQGRPADSFELLRRAMELHPSDSKLEYTYGMALVQLGRPADAESHFARAVQLEPGFTAAECNVVAALAASGRPAEAKAELERAISRDPKNALLAMTREHLAGSGDSGPARP